MAPSTPDVPRLRPLPVEEWGDDVVDALEIGRSSLLSVELQEALASRSKERLAAVLPGAITTMFHNPPLAGAWLAWNGSLLQDPALGGRHRELLVLRVAWRTRSRYEWAQHVRIAPRYGVDKAEIAVIATESGEGPWNEVDAALVRAVDELLDRHSVTDATWEVLRSHLDERQLVEVPFTVGTYLLLALAFNTFNLPLDPLYQAVDAPPLPDLED